MPGSGPTVARAYVAIIPTTRDAQKNISKSLIPDLDAAGRDGGDALSGGISSALQSGASKLATVAKVALAGAGLAAVKQFTSEVVSAYSDFEQLSGGVDAIFGEAASQKVMENARNAFSSVQMSANDYLDTVTGFSASLIQSLGGDTEKAADVANRALVDMADNSNRMGTSIDSLKYAYQGFARGQYTMLDNLKLGYGGTQAEMQRLIADAAAMTDVQEKLGVTVDASSMSFDNIINAISVMQSHLNIAGTASQEAATTLQGSAAMMKASWQNLLVAIGAGSVDEIRNTLSQFVSSTLTYMSNLIPRLAAIFVGIFSGLPSALAEAGKQIPARMSEIMAKTGDVIANSPLGDAVNRLMQSRVVASITSAGSKIRAAFDEVFGTIQLPPIGEKIQAAFSAVSGKVASIMEKMADIVTGALNSISVESLVERFSGVRLIIDKIGEAFGTIRSAISAAYAIAKPFMESLAESVAQKAIEKLAALFERAQSAVSRLGDSITRAFSLLSDALSPIIASISDRLGSMFGNVSQSAGEIDIISTLFDKAFGIIEGRIEKAMAILEPFLSAIGDIGGIITSAFSGDSAGLSDWVDQLVEDLGGAFEGVFNWVTSPFQAALTFIGDVFGDGVKDKINGALSGVSELIRDALGVDTNAEIFQAPFAAVRDAVLWIVDALSHVDFSVISDFLSGAFSTALSVAKGLIDGIKVGIEIISGIFAQLAPTISELIASIPFEELAAFVTSLVGAIQSIAVNLGTIIVDVLQNVIFPILSGVWGLIRDSIIPAMETFLPALWQGISVVADILMTVVDWITRIVSAISEVLRPIIESLFAFIAPIFDAVVNYLVTIWSTGIEVISGIWEKVKPFIDDVVNLVTWLYSEVAKFLNEHKAEIDTVLGIISDAISKTVGWISDTISGMVEGIGKIIGGIVDTVRGIFDIVRGVISGDTDLIKQGFEELVSGIGDIFWGVVDFITAPFRSAFNEIKKLWNNTIGQMHFTVPDWVPGIGGASFGMPKLAEGGTLTRGGTVMVGEAGPEILSLPRGARVTPLDAATAQESVNYNVQVGDVNVTDDDQVRRATREYLEFLATLARPGAVAV